MHSEFKAICLTDETRVVVNGTTSISKLNIYARCMRVTVKIDRIVGQCSDDEGCFCTDMVESKKVFDTSTFELSDA